MKAQTSCYCGKGCAGRPGSDPRVRSERDAVVRFFQISDRMPLYREGEQTPYAIVSSVEEYDRVAGKAETVAKAPASSGEGEVDPIFKARHAEAVAFIAGYTGRFGLILDLRADRRWGTKWFRLSERQVEVVLASKRRDEEYAARQQQAVVSPAGPKATEGWYDMDGQVYKVQKAVHGSGNLYAKVLVIEGDKGRWEYAPGAVTRLRLEMALTVEQAAKYGQLYGICVVCGAPLTDETSIERGIGPVCYGRLAAQAEAAEVREPTPADYAAAGFQVPGPGEYGFRGDSPISPDPREYLTPEQFREWDR